MFFEYPRLLWLEVIPVLLVLHYLYLELKERNPHLRVSTVVPWLQTGRGLMNVIRHFPFLLRTFAIVMIILAIARPRSSEQMDRVDTEGIDIMLAMDVSTSMLARDFTPDRISAAKDIAIEFISQRPYDRMGIVVFAGESYTQCPLTTDRATLINLMKEISTDLIEDGTAIGNGLATAVARMKDVEMMDVEWMYEKEHKQVYTDVFMFSGEERRRVELRLGQLSHNLLVEEYPASESCITDDGGHWIFAADVVSFHAVGRFVLGLYDDISILGSDEFKAYVNERISRMRSR